MWKYTTITEVISSIKSINPQTHPNLYTHCLTLNHPASATGNFGGHSQRRLVLYIFYQRTGFCPSLYLTTFCLDSFPSHCWDELSPLSWGWYTTKPLHSEFDATQWLSATPNVLFDRYCLSSWIIKNAKRVVKEFCLDLTYSGSWAEECWIRSYTFVDFV